MPSSTHSDDSFDDAAFEWNKYLMVRNAEEVPDDFFHHVCKSEQNGIELGSVVEIENEDIDGYWFATVCSSKGVLINLHYFGDENDNYDFWLEVKSPRIHPLNWGSENNENLRPPYPDRFLRVNPKVIKEKVQDCEHVVSNAVLQMGGAPIHNIFKPGMFVEVQDKEFPYRVWISKILRNVGGRLFLKMEGSSCPEKEPFWLFYLNDRIFPFGWAEQKGLPWRVMNLVADMENAIESSLLLNVLKPKTPEQHGYKVGDMLEVLNPHSLMVFYVATIVKIYDNRYFKVEVDNNSDSSKRINFVATKGNPYLFNAGWASKHKFPLKLPSDWTTSNTFCWSKYVSMKNSKLADVDNTCRKKIDYIHIGMKLEAVDPLSPDNIRVATVRKFADNWMFLSFDRTSWCQELLHVRSVFSDDIFPVGWCNKHKYLLNTPKLPFIDCDDFESCYYVSDDNIDINELDKNNSMKYPHYIKGDIAYHYSKKKSQNFEEILEESLQNILAENSDESSDFSKTIDEIDHNMIVDIKEEPPESDEESHNELFNEDEINKNILIAKKEEIDSDSIKNISQGFYKYKYQMCLYFNKSCYPGGHIVRSKIAELPDSVGPGSVSQVLYEAITLIVNSNYFPYTALKKIKRHENMLFNSLGGVTMSVASIETRSRSSHSEHLLLPESKEMAHSYCTLLCNLFGMCEYFLTTERIPCLHTCSKNKCIALKSKVDVSPNSINTIKRKAEHLASSELPENLITIDEQISKTAEVHLDWSNKSLVKRYRFYLSSIVFFESSMNKLEQELTPQEIASIKEIQIKKNHIEHHPMDLSKVFDHGESSDDESCDEETQLFFVDNWKSSFENYYQDDPRFSETEIDIGYFQPIKVISNPKSWSPVDVFNYLSLDKQCEDIAQTLNKKEVDGIAFMMLSEDQLLNYLQCPINLAIRIMCHIAEVKYICLTEYCDV